jgi:hypothetical protein
MHQEKAQDIIRTVLEYITTVEASRHAGSGAGKQKNALTIEVNPDGFPIAPCPPSWDKISKKDLEKLYRTYITLHYRMLFYNDGVLMLISFRTRFRHY